MNIYKIKEFLSILSLLPKAIYYNAKRKKQSVVTKIQYGERKKQYLLLFLPVDKKSFEFTAFFIHGGAWQMGSPEMHTFVGNYFASKGIPAILPAYRLAPDNLHPAQINDVIEAYKKTGEIIKEYGLSKKICLSGHSAGAHLGALLLLDSEKIKKAGANISNIRCFVSLAGPFDFDSCVNKFASKKILEFTKSIHAYNNANPINHVKGDEKVPMLLLQSENDPIVEMQNAPIFAEKINEKSENAEFKIIKNKLHSNLLSVFLKGIPCVNLEEWIRRYI